MIRFERALDVACACCKADGANVPEAEAVIRLLSPQLLAAFALVVDSITARAARLFSSEARGSDLALLLAAYVTSAKRLGQRPLSPFVVRNVEAAARSLLIAAADLSGLPPLTADQLRSRAALAAEQLQLQVEQVISNAVDRSIETAARLAQAPTGAGGSPESVEALRRELAQALDADRAFQSLVDSWAYQSLNAGVVRAAAADGHNFIMLQATRDAVTTAFCRIVDGRIVPMARALAQLDAIDRAVAEGDAAALVSAAPFHPNPREATQQDVDAALERGGLAPFHHKCRTRNVPVRLDVQPS